MPKDIVDLFKSYWNFFKRFVRDFYTLMKFRGRELDEQLQVRYPTTIRALIWMAIALTTIGTVVLILTLLSDFAFSKINLGAPRPSPTPTNQFDYN